MKPMGDTLKSLVKLVVAICILAFFFVPLTPLGNLLPIAQICFSPGYPQNGVFYFTPYQSVAILPLVSMIWISYFNHVRNNLYKKGLWFLLGGLFILLIAQILCASSPIGVARNTAYLLAPLGAGLFVARYCRSVTLIFSCIVGIVIVQSIYAVCYYFEGHHRVISGNIPRAGGTFTDPNALGLLCACAIPMILGIGYVISKQKLRYAILFIISWFCFTLFLSGSRAATLACLLACILMLKSDKMRCLVMREGRGYSILSLTLVVFTFIGVNFVRISNHSNIVSTVKSSKGHVRIWVKGLNSFKHHWAIGSGVGEISFPNEVKNPKIIIHDPENVFIQSLELFGVIGGLLFILFVFFIIRVLSAYPHPYAAPLQAAWLALLTTGLFNPVFGAGSLCGTALIGTLLGTTLIL